MRSRCRPLVLGVALATVALSGSPAAAAPGDLDPSFGEAGIFYPPDFLSGVPNLVSRPDGSIVGALYSGGYPALVSATPKGRLDPHVNNGAGVRNVGPHGAFEEDQIGMARQGGGKVIVAFTSYDPFASDPGRVVVARVRAESGLTPRFGNGGVVDTGVIPSVASEVHVALTQDGGVVVAATAGTFGDPEIVVLRLNPDGSPDTTFSGDGSEVVALGSNLEADDVAVMGDGRIVIAGVAPSFRDEPGDRVGAIGRLLEGGGLDPSFAGDGVVDVGFPGGDQVDFGRSLSVAIGAQDRVVIGGASTTGGFVDTYGSDGSGLSRWALDPAGNGFSGIADVAIDRGGRIAAGGFRNSQAALALLGPDGAPYAAFGNGGVATTPPPTGDSADWRAVTFQRSGKPVVGGEDFTDDGRFSFSVPIFARFQIDKSPGDKDADGFLDRRDRCPKIAARHHHGCPVYKRRLKLKHSARGFSGKVRSKKRSCERAAKVRVRRKRPGRDRMVGTAGRPRHGRFRLASKLDQGRFYARVKPNLLPRVGICKGARSKAIGL